MAHGSGPQRGRSSYGRRRGLPEERSPRSGACPFPGDEAGAAAAAGTSGGGAVSRKNGRRRDRESVSEPGQGSIRIPGGAPPAEGRAEPVIVYFKELSGCKYNKLFSIYLHFSLMLK